MPVLALSEREFDVLRVAPKPFQTSHRLTNIEIDGFSAERACGLWDNLVKYDQPGSKNDQRPRKAHRT